VIRLDRSGRDQHPGVLLLCRRDQLARSTLRLDVRLDGAPHLGDVVGRDLEGLVLEAVDDELLDAVVHRGVALNDLHDDPDHRIGRLVDDVGRLRHASVLDVLPRLEDLDELRLLLLGAHGVSSKVAESLARQVPGWGWNVGAGLACSAAPRSLASQAP